VVDLEVRVWQCKFCTERRGTLERGSPRPSIVSLYAPTPSPALQMSWCMCQSSVPKNVVMASLPRRFAPRSPSAFVQPRSSASSFSSHTAQSRLCWGRRMTAAPSLLLQHGLRSAKRV